MLKPRLLVVLLPMFFYSAAQDGKISGFVLSLGLGYGQANGICMTCGERPSIGGYTMTAEAGYRINRSIAFTFGPGGWIEGAGMFNDETFTNKKTDNSRQTVMIYGYYFPFKNLEAFVKIGVGYGNYFYTPSEPIRVDEGGLTRSSLVNTGFTTSASVGYDVRISRKFSIRPDFNIYRTSIGDLKATTGETIHNSKASVVKSFSVAIVLGPLPFNED